MSLAIDVDKVGAVLIDGEWYVVLDQSFTLDSYEYLWWSRGEGAVNTMGGDYDPDILHGGGQSGICATGFSFKAARANLGQAGGDYTMMSGPLSAIQAVQHKP